MHRFTGLAPSVALHIPWDRVDDFDKLRRHAEDLGLRLGTINTNTFQDDDYKLGSLCHVDERVRAKAIAHMLECIDIMDVDRQQRPQDLAARRTELPRAGRPPVDRQERLADSLGQVYARLGADQRLVLEYKFFEPAFYATDVPDWGTATSHCVALGERAVVCLDTGHHAPGTNIEFIVDAAAAAGQLGSFDFNSRFYADDDLIVGAADPFQLFRILFEVVRGGGYDAGASVAFMLDQCHNIEEKIPGQIRSVLNVQEMLARALLVDRAALVEAQRGRRRAWRATRSSWTPSTPTSGRTWPSGGAVAGCRRTRWPPTDSADTPSRSSANGSVVQPVELGSLSGMNHGSSRSCSSVRTGSAPTGGTPTTPAATPRRRASASTRPPDDDVELLWVKGSGGDLGTLTEAGWPCCGSTVCARSRRVPGRGREDEMVAAMDYCLHGRGRCRPIHRHSDARPGRCPPRRPSASRQRHRHRHRCRRRSG